MLGIFTIRHCVTSGSPLSHNAWRGEGRKDVARRATSNTGLGSDANALSASRPRVLQQAEPNSFRRRPLTSSTAHAQTKLWR